MKKLLVILSLGCLIPIGEINSQSCINCSDPFPFGDGLYRSKVGYNNTVTTNGQYGFAGGENSISDGLRSFAFGYDASATGTNSVSFGSNSLSSGNGSFAFGYDASATGTNSISFGSYSLSSGNGSFAFGKDVSSLSTGTFAFGTRVEAKYALGFVMGSGPVNSVLENNLMETMVVGFNSSKPTLFISRSLNDAYPYDRTGRVAIGNMTEPEAKLHIYSDDDESATLFLQPSHWNSEYRAEIWLGDSKNSFSAEPDIGLVYFSENNHFFEKGKVGIGIENPEYRLDVNGDINLTGYIYWNGIQLNPGRWEKNGDDIYYLDGNVGIGTIDTYGHALAVQGKIITDEVFVRHPDTWYDYVFDDDYNLRTLDELEQFIEKNKHLPDIPNESEVKDNCIAVGELEGLLLKKIEELTLYTINQQKLIEQQQNQIEELTRLVIK